MQRGQVYSLPTTELTLLYYPTLPIPRHTSALKLFTDSQTLQIFNQFIKRHNLYFTYYDINTVIELLYK